MTRPFAARRHSTRAVGPDGQDPAPARPRRRLRRGPLVTLIAGQALGQAGDGLAQVAFAQLVLFEAGRGATPWELAKLLMVTLLPFSVVGPFAGVPIDRWDRRRVLTVMSIVRSGIVLAGIGALTAHSQDLAYVLVVGLLSSSRFVLAAKGAALPHTVADPDLVAANALSAVVGMTAAFVGAVAASAVVAHAPAAGFAAASVAYLAAAVQFRRLPPVGGGTPTSMAAGLRRVRQDLAEEMRTVARVPGVRRPLLAVWAHRFLLGAGFLLLVLVADERFRLGVSGYGVALAVTGVAAFVGSVVAPVLGRRHDPMRLLPAPFLAAGLAALAVGAWHEPPLAALVAAVAVVAMAFQVLKVLADALVQLASADVVRGRVFSAYDVLYNAAFVVAGLALVPLWRPDREPTLLRAIGLGFLVAGLVVVCSGRGRGTHRRGRRRTT